MQAVFSNVNDSLFIIYFFSLHEPPMQAILRYENVANCGKSKINFYPANRLSDLCVKIQNQFTNQC